MKGMRSVAEDSPARFDKHSRVNGTHETIEEYSGETNENRTISTKPLEQYSRVEFAMEVISHFWKLLTDQPVSQLEIRNGQEKKRFC
jgi:hypothetical protein